MSNLNRTQNSVRQFSLFCPNQLGQLHELLNRLATQGTHVLGLSCMELTEGAFLRMVVNYPELLPNVLTQSQIGWTERVVLAVGLRDALGLNDLTRALLRAEVGIHYLYPLMIRPEGLCTLAVCVDQPDMAATALQEKGLRLFSQADLAR